MNAARRSLASATAGATNCSFRNQVDIMVETCIYYRNRILEWNFRGLKTTDMNTGRDNVAGGHGTQTSGLAYGGASPPGIAGDY